MAGLFLYTSAMMVHSPAAYRGSTEEGRAKNCAWRWWNFSDTVHSGAASLSALRRALRVYGARRASQRGRIVVSFVIVRRESGGTADTLDLGSSAFGRGGSSPPSRTRTFKRPYGSAAGFEGLYGVAPCLAGLLASPVPADRSGLSRHGRRYITIRLVAHRDRVKRPVALGDAQRCQLFLVLEEKPREAYPAGTDIQ